MPATKRATQFKEFPGKLNPTNGFPEGDYLSVDTLGNDTTNNESVWSMWDRVLSEAQRFSAKPAALTPEITMDLIQEALTAINRCFACGSNLVITRANPVFHDTYGGPSTYKLEDYAIRWPAENREALNIVLKFVSCGHQMCMVKSNRLDSGILDDHLWTILNPLFAAKCSLMRRYFGIEVKGQISPDELDAMFRNANLQPPLATSLDDRRDTVADLSAEDARAMGHESAAVPTRETIEAAMEGIDAWTWVPQPENWATFAQLLRLMEDSGPQQRPGEPFPFAVGDAIGSGEATAGAATNAGGSRTTTPPATP